MKFPVKSFLIFCWGVLNVTALSMILGAYPVVWHASQFSNNISHEDALKIAHSATREQLATQFVLADTAIRGSIKELLATLNHWLEFTLENAAIILCYYFWTKWKPNSK